MEAVKSTVNAAIETITGSPSIVVIYDPVDEELRGRCSNQFEGLGYDVVCCTTESDDTVNESKDAFSIQHVHHQVVLVISNLKNDVNVLELLQKFSDAEKPVGGIRGGVVTLSKADFCRDIRVVKVDGLSEDVRPIQGETVVRDGRVVTGTTVSDTVRLLNDVYQGR